MFQIKYMGAQTVPSQGHHFQRLTYSASQFPPERKPSWSLVAKQNWSQRHSSMCPCFLSWLISEQLSQDSTSRGKWWRESFPDNTLALYQHTLFTVFPCPLSKFLAIIKDFQPLLFQILLQLLLQVVLTPRRADCFYSLSPLLSCLQKSPYDWWF